MKMKIEIRNDKAVVSGYVNAVGRDSRPITDVRGKFVEQIEPGAFRASLERSENVDLLLNHDKSKVYASTKDGNLKLTEDNIGLRAEAVLSDAEMIRKARSGEFRGWSFGMYVGDSAMEERAEGIPRRHVKSLNMFEVSLIDKSRIPCYVGTSVECRSDGEILAELRYSEEEPEIIEEERSEPEPVDYSAVDDVISELRYGAVDNVIAELRYNPYHDPSNGRFTSGGGGGGGGVLVVEKGQKGKGVYVVPSEKFEKGKIGNAEQQHSIERIEKKLSERPDTSKMPEYKLDEVGNVVFSYETKKIVSKGHGKMNYAEDVYERTYRRDGIIFTDGTVRFRDVGGTSISEKLISKGKPEKTISASSSKASNVETYVINKGTPSQYFGLKTPDGEVIHAPNNWKTEKGALNWAKKNGYASRAFDPIDSKIEELRYNPYHDPSNGRFCSGGGSGGGGGVLVVEKGQKGKGVYVVDVDHDEEYEKWKAEKQNDNDAFAELPEEPLYKYGTKDLPQLTGSAEEIKEAKKIRSKTLKDAQYYALTKLSDGRPSDLYITASRGKQAMIDSINNSALVKATWDPNVKQQKISDRVASYKDTYARNQRFGDILSQTSAKFWLDHDTNTPKNYMNLHFKDYIDGKTKL